MLDNILLVFSSLRMINELFMYKMYKILIIGSQTVLILFGNV